MLIITTFMFWAVYHAAEEEASWHRMEICLLLNHNTFAWTTSCVVNILQYELHMFSEDSSSWIVVTPTADSWPCLMPVLALRCSYHSCAYCMWRQPSGSFRGSAQPTLQTAQGMPASPYAYLNALLKATSILGSTRNWNVLHFWVFPHCFYWLIYASFFSWQLFHVENRWSTNMSVNKRFNKLNRFGILPQAAMRFMYPYPL